MEETPLRLLLIERSESLAREVVTELTRHGFAVTEKRADGIDGGIPAGIFDLAVCDLSLPGLDPLAALDRLRAVPVVFICPAIKEPALEAMRAGAADVLSKDQVGRLGEIAERELQQAASRLDERFVAIRAELLERAISGTGMKPLLEFIITRAEALAPAGVRCSIIQTDSQIRFPTLVVGPDLAGTLLEALHGISADATQAAGTHPEWEDFEKAVLSHGWRSSRQIQLSGTGGGFVGVLGVYFPMDGSPAPLMEKWQDLAAGLSATAIETGGAAARARQNQMLLQIESSITRTGAWKVDLPEGTVVWSDELCAIHEVPPGTVPNLTDALDFYPLSSREQVRETFERCRDLGVPFDIEAEFVTARGQPLWVRSIGECVRNDTGGIVRVQGVLQDITHRKDRNLQEARFVANRRETEEAIRANELRYLRQRNALISLTNRQESSGADLISAFQRITESTARTLDVGRVSVWRCAADHSEIECLDQFELAGAIHSSGTRLAAADYPAYFKGLRDMEIIAADDAHVDPATRGFLENYLRPAGITSMLDVPIRSGEAVHHVLCCEHTGPPREWMPDEKTFAVAVANQIALALEIHKRAKAQEEERRSHQRFQSVAAATNDTIWDWDLVTDVFWWNDGHANLFGWSSGQTGESIRAWTRQIHPADRGRIEESVHAAIRNGDIHWSGEYRFLSTDGSISHVLDRGQIFYDEDGKPVRMVGGMTDLTARKAVEFELIRTHRALRLLSSCNEMLIRTSDEKSLLAEACRLAVEIGGYRMAWVGYAINDDKQRVLPMAKAGEELGYLEEVEITWADDHSSGVGPAGQAIRGGRTVVFEDVVGNPAFYYWLAPASKRGYRSVVCLPLKNRQRVFGVLCLYGGEPHPAGNDEIRLLEEMAKDLSFGITSLREKERRQLTQEVVVKVAQAVSSGTGSEFFDLLTRNMVEALAAYGGIIGRLDPADNSIHTISYVLNGEPQENVTYSLAGTPCEDVMNGDICVFEQNLQQLFPDDHMLATLGIEAYAGIPLLRQDGAVAGLMAVFFSAPLTEVPLVKSTLRIFATRAASEMDRLQADSRIREQASLLDKARDAILVRDLDHRITYWNKSAERLYGWSAEEAIGRSVLDLIYRDKGPFLKAQDQMLAYDEWQGEVHQVAKDGRDITVDGRWTLVRDERGQPECVFVLNSDISEHRKLEQQFLRAQRIESIGTLAGGIAHDLNNMLAPISMSIELLKMRVTEPRSVELLDTIASSAKRGTDMVGQVLSFARGMEGRRVEVNPRQLIREIENILRDTLLRKIELSVRTDRKLRTIHGDPTQLHQVILNLCVNARDAIHGDGRITITARNVDIDAGFAAMNLEAKEGPYIYIQVEDTGEGIPPGIMDKIFDPFFTTKSVGKGTGLGLSTSLAIVKGHGGFIHTTSRPGHGTRFRVYLPASPDQSELSPPAAEVVLPSGNGEMVLIVDDEDSIRNITRQTLEAFGYHTMQAVNGEEAVDLFSNHHSTIDVVLTDMMMPGLDGAGTIERLRQIVPAVKIIATSGIINNRELALGGGKGTRNFLPKPYTAETLLTCLAGVLAAPAKDR